MAEVTPGSIAHLRREFGIAASYFQHNSWRMGAVDDRRDGNPHTLVVAPNGAIVASFDKARLLCSVDPHGVVTLVGTPDAAYIDAFRRMLMKLGRPFK